MRVFFTLLIFISITQGNASDQDLSFDTSKGNSSKDKSFTHSTKSHISRKSSDTEDSDTEDVDPSFTKAHTKKAILPKSQSELPSSLPAIPPLKMPPVTIDGERSPPATHAVKSPRPRPKSLIFHTPRDEANTIERPQHSLTLEDLVKTGVGKGDSTLISQNTDALEASLPTRRKKSSFLSFLTPRSSGPECEEAARDSSETSNSQRMEKQPSLLLKTFRSLYPSKKSITDSKSTDLEIHELAPHFPQSPASSSSMTQSVETSISLEQSASLITFESIITPEFSETYQKLEKFYEEVSSKQKASKSLTQNIEVAEIQLRHITERILERLPFAERTLLYHWYQRRKSLCQKKINETEAERVCRAMKGFQFKKDDDLETVVEYRATSLIPENQKRIIFLADLFANFFEIQYKGACVADLCTIPYTDLSGSFLLFLTFPSQASSKKTSASKIDVTFKNKNFHIKEKLIFQEDPSKSDPTHPGLQIFTLGMQTDITNFRFYNDHSAVFLLKGLKHRFEWFEYIDWRRMLFSGIEQSIDFIQSAYIETRKRKDLDFIGWKNKMNLPYIQELLHYVHPEKAYAGQTAYYSIPGISEGLISLLDHNLVTPREKPSDLPTPLPETTTEESAILN